MAYVGNQTTTSFTSMEKQVITGNGGASYTLSHAVANAAEVQIFVNNVRQEPLVAYNVAGTALTMTGNVASSDDFYVVYSGKAVQTVVPPDGSVGTAKLASGAVTMAKLATSGTLPALDGSALTGVGVSGITSASPSGTAMSIDSSNRITTPARPAFSARGSGSWVDVADSATTTIVMATADINTGGYYSTSTYKFTAPVAGVYHFSAIVYLRNNGGSSSDSGTYGYIKMQKNNSNIAGIEAIHGYLNNGDADQTHSISGLVQLAVNDTVHMVMQSAGGGTSSFHGGNTSFHGYLVG